jgi:hypothetical protein
VLDIQQLSRLILVQQLRSSRQNHTAFEAGESGSNTAGSVTKQRGTKRKLGGGGQRRYIHEQHARTRLPLSRATLTTWNNAYNSLPLAEKQQYIAKGRAAKQNWRSMARLGMSSFGTNTRIRESRLAAETQVRKSILSRSSVRNVEGVVLALSGNDDLMSNPCDASAWRSSLKNARALTRIISASTLERSKRGAKELLRWQRSIGVECLDAFSASLNHPLPAELKARMMPEPAVGLNVFRYDVAPPQSVSEFASFVYDQHGARDLKKSLQEDWVRRHLPHLHAECNVPVVPGLEPASGIGPDHNASPCSVTGGICLCGLAGQALVRFRNSFVAAFKAEFSPAERTQLGKQGFIAAHLLGTNVDDKSQPDDSRWLHIGMLYLTPFRPTFVPLIEVSRESVIDPCHPDRAVLEVAPSRRAQLQYQAFGKLPLRFSWQVQFYVLEDSDRPIAVFNAGRACVIRRRRPATTFWRKASGDDDLGGHHVEPVDEVPWGLDFELEDEEDDVVFDGSMEGAEEVDSIIEGLFEPLDVASEDSDPPLVHPGAAGSVQLSVQPEPSNIPPVGGDLDHAVGAPLVLGPAGAVAPVVPHGPQGVANAVVREYGGTLSFYRKGLRFTAVCGNPLHGKCVLTRHATRFAQLRGRPVAFMFAWLGMSSADTKEGHWDCIPEIMHDLPLRIDSRALLSARPDGRAMLECQRELTAGEIDPEI